MSRPTYTVKMCRRKKDKGCFELRRRGEVLALLKPMPEFKRLIIYAESEGIIFSMERQLELPAAAAKAAFWTRLFGQVWTALKRRFS